MERTENIGDCRITVLTMADYAEVYDLWRSCEGIGLSEADSPEDVRVYLERNPGMSFVARVDGRVVAAVLSGHDGRRGFVHHLAVHPDRRRLGLGRELAERCLDALRAAGIRKCHLFIYNSNEDGIAFWRRLGWTLRDDIGLMSLSLEQ